jgi:hypothetical protein
VKPRRSERGWLLNVCLVLVANLLTRVIGYLLEVPSAHFSLRDGFKTFAGWLLLYAISILALEAIIYVFRKWTAPQEPPPADDPYLQARADVDRA